MYLDDNTLMDNKLNTNTLREEHSQINVILQQKQLAATFTAVCPVYKQ